jgi:hypothetical protein
VSPNAAIAACRTALVPLREAMEECKNEADLAFLCVGRTGVPAAILIASRAQSAPVGPGVEFSAISLGPGERARLIAINGAPSAERGSCGVAYSFLDTRLQIVKEAVAVLKAGEASELELSRRDLPGNGSVKVHSILQFGYSGGAPPSPTTLVERYDCNIVPSLEVYDPAGTVRLRLTDARPLPPPPGPQQ